VTKIREIRQNQNPEIKTYKILGQSKCHLFNDLIKSSVILYIVSDSKFSIKIESQFGKTSASLEGE
jgi:hypothetical protein